MRAEVQPPAPADDTGTASVLAPPLPSTAGERVYWRHLPGAAKSLAIARAARAHAGPILLIAADTHGAQLIVEELRFFLAGTDAPALRIFPDWETLPYDRFPPYQDIVSERVATLAALAGGERAIVVAGAATLLQRLPPRGFIDAHAFILATGERLDRGAFQRRLEGAGYRRVGQVMEHGDYALRGELVDVFPMGSERPFRLDLFDEEIESIRFFDAETQRSAEPVERLRLLPAREFPLDDAGVARFKAAWRARFEGNPARCAVYADVANRLTPAGIEYYLPLFFERTESMFDYLDPAALVIAEEGVAEHAARFRDDAVQRHELLRHDAERPILDPGELFFDADWLGGSVGRFRAIDLGDPPRKRTPGVHQFAATVPPSIPIDARARDPLAMLKQYLAASARRILLVAESAGRRESILELLRGHGIAPVQVDGWNAFLDGDQRLALATAPIGRGAELAAPGLSIVAESQLYGERAAQRRRRRAAARDTEGMIRNLAELAVGAPVVHEQHGVGRYLGLTALEVDGVQGEFLLLEYADGDKLYVPVGALELVSRYTGPDPDRAPLNKLGSGQWQRARERAEERVRDVAAELLDLHAQRAARQGHRFSVDPGAYAAFAAAFPFEETPDQEAAIAAVLADMQSAKPMDRVVCGDAGFGKTEVAMRATFVAALDGRQVAVLVPTTLLAQQHFQNFKDRFADWPVRIELLSRFRSRKDQGAVLEAVAAGTVDVVVGTHKLLSESLRFKNLGLLVIDEEHRFGVRQKDRMKELRAEVDILTLTATPIPRTLDMALSGVRDLSLIATPPSRRVPVTTFVRKWDDGLLREAMLREINRGGQVFFVHNDVETIERMTQTVSALLPQARVRFAHGQMREVELEAVMLDFYHLRFNVLVCSTIIETGIDIPSANTIIINRADRFGLAQLYQLRGRVGRSHHRAYAYLVVPEKNAMTADAVQRLQAIEALEDLGIGFTLATQDLEIRGAGEMLGEEQSGHMQAIGYGLYMDLLRRAVAALKSGREPTLAQPLRSGPEVKLGVATLIPEDYLQDVHARLVFYKRIAGARSDAELDDLAEELVDRFGNLPPQARSLLRLAALKLRAGAIGVVRIDLGPEGGRIQFGADARVDGAAVVRLIQTDSEHYRLEGREKLRIRRALPDPESRFQELDRLLERIALKAVA
ncbi:MAG: transcription-repair coupling factor [Gammaproteobacteria bacterium]